MPLQFALPTTQNAAGDKGGYSDFLKEGDGAPQFALDAARIEPTAIPTPFARGHAMSAAFRLAPQPPAQHAQWRTVVLGLALGHVELELLDLRDPAVAAPRVRTALRNADPDGHRRYLGLFRTTSKERAIVGATDPDCLAWPSPRRFDGEGIADSSWSALRTEVERDNRTSTALRMWWGARRMLLDAGWWDAGIPWMHAVDWLLEGTKNDDEQALALRSRGTGPVRLVVANPSVATGRQVKALYLPVLDETAAKDLLDACMTGVERKGAMVEIKDAVGKVARTVRLPVPVGDADAHELGAGVTSPRAGALGFERPSPRPLQLERWFDAFAPVYNRVTPNILEEQRLVPLTAPDPIRLVTLWLGDLAAKTDRPVTYSRRAVSMLFLDDQTGQGRLPPASAFGSAVDDLAALLDAPQLGAVLSLNTRDASGSTKGAEAVFVERWRQGGNIVDIGDLSAVGASLWAVFSGAAELDAASGKLFFNSEELRLLRDDRPFELTDAIREQLMALAPDAARRLATLQRFVRAYPAPIEAGPTLPRLCWLASRVFARRAFGSEPLAQGAPPDPARAVKATVWPGITLSLFVSEDTRG